jgi:hypothetical protein
MITISTDASDGRYISFCRPVYQINGEYYIPILETRDGNGSLAYIPVANEHTDPYFFEEGYDAPGYTARARDITSISPENTVATPKYRADDYPQRPPVIPNITRPLPGKVVGKATKVTNFIINISLGTDKYVSAYELDGDYYLVALKDLQKRHDDKPHKDGSNTYYTGGIYYNTENKIFYFSLSEKKPIVNSTPSLLDEYIKQIVNDKMTDREKLKAVHDFIINHLEYSKAKYYENRLNTIRDPTGIYDEIDPAMEKKWNELETKIEAEIPKEQALVEEAKTKGYMGTDIVLYARTVSICGDYAMLFNDFCDKLGMPCMWMVGTNRAGYHAWNKVYCDGE